MRIGIDAHAVGSRLGGNETYIVGLLDALGQVESPHEFIGYFASDKAAKSWRKRYENLDIRVFKSKSSLPRLLAELPLRTAADRLDLLHVQYVAPPIRTVPVVATIHDICYEFSPQFFSRSESLQYRSSIRWTARHSRRVITISENSKRDLVNTYGLPPADVDVSYLGVDFSRYRPFAEDAVVEGVLDKHGIRKPYVLAVGNLQPRKNLVRLIDAFVELKRGRRVLPHSLVVVGKAAYRHHDIFGRVREHGLDEQVVFTGYVPDDHLPVLYQGASVFAYPSLYEGFGLPVVEAMACGAPVLTSNSSAIPEVTGGAAMLVDPENTRSITEGLLRILTNPSLAASLAEQGVQRAQGFTWENTARATLAAFESAVSKEGS